MYEKLDNLKLLGNLSPRQVDWLEILVNIFDKYLRAEVEAFKEYNDLEKGSAGGWLDNFGNFLELQRTSSIVLKGDAEDNQRDNLYRLSLLAKADAIYDDYTHDVFVKLAENLNLKEKFNFWVLSDRVVYFFFDLDDEENAALIKNYELLYSYNVGRDKVVIQKGRQKNLETTSGTTSKTGLKKTFYFGRGFGSLLPDIFEEKDL